MKNIILFLSITALVMAHLFNPKNIVIAEAPDIQVIDTNSLTLDEIINRVSSTFNQDPLLIKKIIMCESGGKDLAHDGGLGQGVTGLHIKTFNYWLVSYKEEFNETLNYVSAYDQIKLMSWAFSKGEDYRRAWSTYRAYKNGGVYSFYSKTLKGNFTARCK